MNDRIFGIVYLWIGIGMIWLYFQEPIYLHQKHLAIFGTIFNFGLFWWICVQPQLRISKRNPDYN